MKRIFTLFISLVFIFSSEIPAFAGSKGDPLDEHENYLGMLRNHFERLYEERKSPDPDVPFKWEKYPSYIMFCDDYRTVRVYNIPLLLK